MRKIIKILIIGTTDNKGGAASVGWDIGNGLIEKGYNVKYLVGYKFTKSKNVFELKKPWITKILEKYIKYDITGFCRHFISFIKSNDLNIGANMEILNHPWYKQSDIVLCQNLHGSYFKLDTLAQMAREKRVIWVLHDMWAIIGNSVYAEASEAWTEGARVEVGITEYPPMLFNNAKKIWHAKKNIYENSTSLQLVVPSKWLGKRVKDSILNGKLIDYIYNGIDTSIFRQLDKQALRRKFHFNDSTKIITFVARGGKRDPRKGWKYIDQITSAYKNDNSILFLCIGGSERKKDSNILYIPNISDKNILSEYYSISDILLFTSKSDNCPMVVLEAMGCGVPVVAFKVGGIPEIIAHKQNGYMAKHKNIEDLKIGINWILKQPKKVVKNISENNIKVIKERFSLENMIDNYEKIILKSLNK